jgi:hypothetical protein
MIETAMARQNVTDLVADGVNHPAPPQKPAIAMAV